MSKGRLREVACLPQAHRPRTSDAPPTAFSSVDTVPPAVSSPRAGSRVSAAMPNHGLCSQPARSTGPAPWPCWSPGDGQQGRSGLPHHSCPFSPPRVTASAEPRSPISGSLHPQHLGGMEPFPRAAPGLRLRLAPPQASTQGHLGAWLGRHISVTVEAFSPCFAPASLLLGGTKRTGQDLALCHRRPSPALRALATSSVLSPSTGAQYIRLYCSALPVAS